MPQVLVGIPDPSEYAPYYGRYIGLIKNDDIIAVLGQQAAETTVLLRSFTEEASNRAYAPGKWNVKEVVGHMIDTERVFGSRALFIARKDPAALPGFEQDDWIRAASFSTEPFREQVDEFICVRQSHLHFFRHLSAEAWHRRGIANRLEFSVRAVAYMIAGHERHHLEILRRRYV